MTAKKRAARTSLQQASEVLIAEVLGGKRGHSPGIGNRPIEQWADVLAQLERQCPGFTPGEYVDALARANRDNR